MNFLRATKKTLSLGVLSCLILSCSAAVVHADGSSQLTPSGTDGFAIGAGDYGLRLDTDCSGGDVVIPCASSRVVTKWTFAGGATPGHIQLKVYKKISLQGAFVAESSVENASPSVVNEYATRIPLPAGETFYAGLATSDLTSDLLVRSTDARSDTAYFIGVPASGTTFSLDASQTKGLQLNLKATVEHDVDVDGFGDTTQDADDDNDGIPDSADNCSVVASSDQTDLDLDGQGNVCDADDDGDEALDAQEISAGSNPRDRDSDDDGIIDLEEGFTMQCIPGCGQAPKYKTSPIKSDTDGDGIKDGVELGVKKPISARGNAPGSDTSKFRADRNPKWLTDPLKKDTDRDGIRDGREDRNHNGRRDRKETDAALKDTDNDGKSDRWDHFPLTRARH